jgi:prophage antirepressor-like protein
MEETTASAITTFKFAGHEPVRTSIIEGKIWFVAQDVAQVLGIPHWKTQVARLNDDEKGALSMSTPGGRQNMTAVSETGIFTLIIRSRKQKAFALREWIASTVLPALHAEGTYSIPSVQVSSTVPTTFSQALYLAAQQAEKIEKQQVQLALEAPKVAFFDTVASSSDTTDIGTVAKTLAVPGLGRTNLFDLLRKKSILQENNRPYQRYVDAGYFRVIESSWNDPSGDTHVYYKTVVFQKGLDFIRQLIQGVQA